ncbi:MAG TPA: DUF1343 domain-containing protein [Saprospiraceae bacterium]|nr:DUF1343 domain-containing protein [Saprospiraceae bacterium]
MILVRILLLIAVFSSCHARQPNFNILDQERQVLDTILPGACQTELYFPLLKNKKVGLVINQTSLINKTHLVDSLLNVEIKVQKIYAPEHGFRGEADAGEDIADQKDKKTGITLISIYGKKMKPTKEDLDGIDILVFDIQDVGARFYTYISTLHYIMEACAENKIPLIVLDRPNPNGHYIDGPIMESGYTSFVGLDPLPVVYGLTIGELAKMINGEHWLKDGMQCDLQVIPVKNYDHNSRYELPVNPSPNLRNMRAIYLYPSICFFEGTIVSVGRGTDHPFETIGYPGFLFGSFMFTPKPIPGAMDPPYKDQQCTGTSLAGIPIEELKNIKQLRLDYLLSYFKMYTKEDFFLKNLYFDKLAGTDKFRRQIIEGKSEVEIRESWKEGLDAFKVKRKKYLLYKDFY